MRGERQRATIICAIDRYAGSGTKRPSASEAEVMAINAGKLCKERVITLQSTAHQISELAARGRCARSLGLQEHPACGTARAGALSAPCGLRVKFSSDVRSEIRPVMA